MVVLRGSGTSQSANAIPRRPVGKWRPSRSTRKSKVAVRTSSSLRVALGELSRGPLRPRVLRQVGEGCIYTSAMCAASSGAGYPSEGGKVRKNGEG